MNSIIHSHLHLSIFSLLGREIRSTLRGKKTFVLMIIFLTALLIVVILNWRTICSAWTITGDASGPSRIMFHILAQSHLLFVILFTPLLVAPSFAEERERGTIDLLLSSPVSATSLILAKLFGPIHFLFLLLIAALPVLSLCFLGGGISGEEIALTYVLLITTILTYGSMALFCSTLRSRVYEVYLITTGFVIFFTVVLPFNDIILRFVTASIYDPNYKPVALNEMPRIFSSFIALRGILVLDSRLINIRSAFSNNVWLVFFPYLAMSWVLCLLFFIATLNRVKRISRGLTTTKKVKEKVSGKKKGRFYDLLFRDIATDFSRIVVHRQEKAGRMLETRAHWFARSAVLIRLFYLGLIASILFLPLASFQTSVLFFSFPFLMTILFTLPLAATRISSERERNTLDLLRTTLLPTRDFVQAKLKTSLQYSFCLAMALFIPGMLVRLMFGWIVGYKIATSIKIADCISILIYPIFLYCILRGLTSFALFSSAYFQKTNKAMLFSGVIISLLLIISIFLPFIGATRLSHGATNLLSLKYGPIRLIYFEFYLLLLKGISLFCPYYGILALASSKHFSFFKTISYSVPMSTSAFNRYFDPYLFIFIQCGLYLFLAEFFLDWAIKAADRKD